MGNQQSDSLNSNQSDQPDQSENWACNIAPYVSRVIYGSSDSIYQNAIVELYDRYKVYSSIEVPKRIEIKICLVYLKSIYRYEVYENLIKKITEYNISPHFHEYYGGSDKCNIENIVDLLAASEDAKSTIRERWVRLVYMILNESDFDIFRPTPDEELPEYYDTVLKRNITLLEAFDTIQEEIPNYKFILLLTEISTGYTSLEDILNKDGLNTQTWILLIQLLSVPLVLSYFKSEHGEFNFRKIPVKIYDEPLKLRYIWTDRHGNYHTVMLSTRYLLMVSDWKNCTMELFGKVDANDNILSIEYNHYADVIDVYSKFLTALRKPPTITVQLFRTLFPLKLERIATVMTGIFLSLDVQNYQPLRQYFELSMEDIFTKLVLFVSHTVVNEDSIVYIEKMDSIGIIDASRAKDEIIYDLSSKRIINSVNAETPEDTEFPICIFRLSKITELSRSEDDTDLFSHLNWVIPDVLNTE